MQPTAWLCDFDGTISPGDIGAELLRAFSPGRDAEREALLADWSAGRIGHRVLSTRECALMTMTEPEALGVARSHELDPAFAPFVREVEARGDAVMVVSEGFGFYISGLLQREGLTRVRWAANRMIFEAGGRVGVEFPFHDPECLRCGNCKGRHVRDWRERGYRTVMVGDGRSDRCGAGAADRVLASGALLEWCRRVGLAAEPFEDFRDIAEAARAEHGESPVL